MPTFATPFSGNSNKEKLSTIELMRAIRFMLAAEYEAIQMYMQVVESTDNPMAKKVIKSIADEERVHAGEFLKLLTILDPSEAKYNNKGSKEVTDLIRS